MEFLNLGQAQNEDETIQEKLKSGDYVATTFGDYQLATTLVDGEQKIVIPLALIDNVIRWYHVILGHAGQERLIKSIRKHLFFVGLNPKVKKFVETCDNCQRYKNAARSYGQLPLRDDFPAPFEEVCVDHIGPWTIKVPGLGTLKFEALTIIDSATALVELTRVESTSSEDSALAFENTWLSRYPRPSRCVYDAGGAFAGVEFQFSLHREGITGVPITVKNPQSNALIERSHSTVGDQLRVLQAVNAPDSAKTAYDIVDTALATSQRALRAAIHKSLNVAPGAVVFNRDMLLNVPLLIDLDKLNERRYEIAERNNLIENKRRTYHNYTAGDEIMVAAYQPTKMGARWLGPFTIIQVHVNGTVTFQRKPNVTERINIRRIKPYKRRY